MPERDEDRVGYGCAPKWGEVQKGKSGNPKGRPSKKHVAKPPSPSELDDLLSELFSKKVTITEQERSR